MSASNFIVHATPKANNNPLAYLHDLQAAGRQWSEGYESTMEKLYRLLAKCMEGYEQLQASDRNVRKQFFRVCEDECGINSSKKYHLTYRIVAYVFGIKGPRVGAYVRVLRIAIAEKVGSGDFFAWLDSRGGIEAVRRNRNGKSPAEIRADKTERAGEALAIAQGIMDITNLPEALHHNASNDNNFSIALIRHDTTNNTGTVVWASTSAVLINAALAAAAKQVVNEHGQPVVNVRNPQSVAEDLAAIDTAIEAATSIPQAAM